MRSIFFPFRKIEKETGVRYATFSSRCFAMTVDMLLIYIVLGPLLYKMSEIFFPELPLERVMEEGQYLLQGLITGQLSGSEAWHQAVEVGLVARMAFDYGFQILVTGVIIVGIWHRWSTTPGLALLGTEIVDADTGGAPSLRQYVLRYLGVVVTVLSLMIGMVWMLFDSRRQTWHDKMANTLVLKKRSWLLGREYAEENREKSDV